MKTYEQAMNNAEENLKYFADTSAGSSLAKAYYDKAMFWLEYAKIIALKERNDK